MHIRQIKILDTTIGCLGVFMLPVPVQSNHLSNQLSLLLIRPGGIGDAVLLVPAIRALKKINPHVHITIMAEQRNGGIFQLISGVDSILCYDRPREFIHALRGRYDVVIDTEQWHRLSAVVARLVRAPVKIGFDTNERRRMFTHLVPYSHDDYETASFRRLLVPLGLDDGLVDWGAPFLALPVSASVKAAGLLEPLDGKPFVVVFPGASIPERRWGAERFSSVARRLVENSYRIVVVGGYEDRAEGEIIARAGGLNLSDLTTLAETAAVISRSRLVISGDSGVLHMAVGLDVPTVSLFGPGIAAKWAPRGEKHIVINKSLPCSPCTKFGNTPKCLLYARCMAEISVDEVANAVERLLGLQGKPEV
jgi:ADP-heptose:LPS heptosyltransferase